MLINSHNLISLINFNDNDQLFNLLSYLYHIIVFKEQFYNDL